MKFIYIVPLFMLNSCSDIVMEEPPNGPVIVVNYSYSTSELETLDLINNYRISIGINPLIRNSYISSVAEEHNNYMINNNVVNHNGFVYRSESIIKALNAIKVSENIAYNYKTPQAVLNAWLASSEHRKIIESDYTYFGISIRENLITGRKYYTNIFAKI